ncbi:MAG: DUF5009 domain-containing protein [Chitinophagaceae bacterium]|nr:DUF5009 domain-containing protein [Chitinophagaceae bacterium]
MNQSLKSSRVEALDALRGIAIFGMVLSGSIAFGDVLPAWMYHAQVPPPLHQFNPALPGITWVDLVFPLFLFCMGAAISFSVSANIKRGLSKLQLCRIAGRRFLQLLFFALFFQHCKAWVISEHPTINDHLLSIFGFLLLFGQFYDAKGKQPTLVWGLLKASSYLIGIVLLVVLPFSDGKGFDFYRSDIIIVVLANMALFAGIIYVLTINRPIARGLLLVAVAAIILSAREPYESGVKQFFYFKEVAGYSFDWAYKFYFLKYLFIVIPGTWVGDWLLNRANEQKPTAVSSSTFLTSLGASILLLCLLILLFERTYLNYSFLVVIGLGILSWLRFKNAVPQSTEQRLATAGIFLLFIGLLLEPYEGGIKKDPSTFSYYFVTAGYGCWGVLLLLDFANYKLFNVVTTFFAALGKNPLVAYATGSLLILPLLSILGWRSAWDGWATTPWLGFFKGIIFTLLVSGITILFNRFKLYWRS